VIDGRNLYDPSEMQERRFTYLSVGRPSIYHAKAASGRRTA